MDLLSFIGGFLLTCLLWSLISNLWVRFAWHVLGIKPDILLEDQLSLTVRECADVLEKHMDQYANAMREAVCDEDRDFLTSRKREFCEVYTRGAIQCYIHNFKLPRLTKLRNVGVPQPKQEVQYGARALDP